MIKDRQAYEIRNGGFGILDRYEEDLNDSDSSKRKVWFNKTLIIITYNYFIFIRIIRDLKTYSISQVKISYISQVEYSFHKWK